MGLNTLNDIYFAITRRNQPELFLRRGEQGWLPISSGEFASYVAGTARDLRSWGIRKGDRVAILSENRHEWVIADFACLLLGAVVVPIYTTLTPDQIAYLLRDSGARAIFVSTEPQLHKVLSIHTQTAIERIAVMDHVASDRAMQMSGMMTADADPEIETIGRRIQPEDLATIIYTSGTTGVPKGVMLTHGNMSANINF